jgi:hypothetical protein
MAKIKVPTTPKSAFNPKRPPSGLIQAQIQHLEAAAGLYQVGTARRSKVRTEGAAADYIAQLTAQIYQRAGAQAGPELAVPQPAPPIAGTATPTSTTRRRTTEPQSSTKAAPKRRRASGAKQRKSSRAKTGRGSSAKRGGRARREVVRKSSKRARRRG